MRPRDVLAENFKELLKAREVTFPQLTEASRKKLTNGTLDRIRRGEVAITLDKLGDLAEVFNLQPWQLLVPGLNPEALPVLADQSFLEQVKQLVHAPIAGHPSDKAREVGHAHQQKAKKGRDLSPALKKALDVKGIGRNEPGKSVSVQKPRTRRRA